jgi:hypothetical protein
MESLAILAMFLGPVVAVLITRYIDSRRETRQRRWEIFRTLMGSRMMLTSADFVGALNLVEVEFQGQRPVLEAWKTLMEHYAKPEWNSGNKEAEERLTLELRDKLARLLHAMATSFGLKIDQLDIFRGGYLPRAWEENAAANQKMNQDLLQFVRDVSDVARANLLEKRDAGSGDGY